MAHTWIWSAISRREPTWTEGIAASTWDLRRIFVSFWFLFSSSFSLNLLFLNLYKLYVKEIFSGTALFEAILQDLFYLFSCLFRKKPQGRLSWDNPVVFLICLNLFHADCHVLLLRHSFIITRFSICIPKLLTDSHDSQSFLHLCFFSHIRGVLRILIIKRSTPAKIHPFLFYCYLDSGPYPV